MFGRVITVLNLQEMILRNSFPSLMSHTVRTPEPVGTSELRAVAMSDALPPSSLRVPMHIPRMRTWLPTLMTHQVTEERGQKCLLRLMGNDQTLGTLRDRQKLQNESAN